MNQNGFSSKAYFCLLLILASLLDAGSVSAASKVWNCNWLNNNWATGTNWVPAGVPQNGDDLVFPSGVRLDSVNNMASLRVNSITITGGQDIDGNAITVSNGLTFASGSFFNFNLAVTLGDHIAISGNANSIFWGGNINLNGFNLNINAPGYFELRSIVSGTGHVIKNGVGRIVVAGNGPNTFAGSFTQNDGELWAAKTLCFPGDFTTWSQVQLLGQNVFSSNSTVTLRPGSYMEDSSSDTTNVLANLVMVGGTIEAINVTFVLRSNLTVQAANTNSTIIATLDLGNTSHTFQVANGPADPDIRIAYGSIKGGANGGFTKMGFGTLRTLDLSTPYGGVTTINEGIVDLSGQFGGLGNNKAIVNSGATLRLSGSGLTLGTALELHGNGVGGSSGALSVTTLNNHQGTITVPVAASIRCDATLHAQSVLAGAGELRLNGSGEFWTHGGANTRTGNLIVESGVFVLDKPNGTSVGPGPIIVGTNSLFSGALATMRNFESNQITGPVILNNGAVWELPGDTFEGAANVTMVGAAEILANGGTFQLDGTLTVVPLLLGSTARIYGGNVSFGSGAARTIDVGESGGLLGFDPVELEIHPSSLAGSAPVVKIGPGDLRLSGLFGFSSAITVQEGHVHADSITPLGGSTATTLAGSGSLILEGSAFDTEPLIVNGGGSVDCAHVIIAENSGWRGLITLNAPCRVDARSNTTWTVNAPISGIGAFVAEGPGTVLMDWYTTNSHTGGTWVKNGDLRLERSSTNVSVPGSLTIGDGVGAARTARAIIGATSQQIADTSDVHLFDDGQLLLTNLPVPEIIRTLNGSGEIVVSNSTLRLNDSGNNSDFSGTIRGNGDLIKAGTGVLTLEGNSFASGMLFSMFGGTVVLNGSWNNSPGSLIDAYSGTGLKGNGIAPDVTIRTGASLQPGTSVGRFTARNLMLQPSSALVMEADASGVDQIVVTAGVALTNCALTVIFGTTPVVGQEYVLIDNRSATPVRGAFNGRPEGSVLNLSGNEFVISYGGGDGNDVTLTALPNELTLQAAVVLGGNGNGTVDANECNDLRLVLTNRSGLALAGVTATLDTLTPEIAVTQQRASYGTIPAGARATNTTAFRFTTLPTFACGQTAEFLLTLNLGAFGTYSIPFALPSGVAGTTEHFSPRGIFSVAIPDLATTNATLQVTNFPGRVGGVTVSLHLAHTYVGDLRIKLRSPSGSEVLLVARRGGSNNGFGTNCTAPTVFDDAAAQSITNAAAPFLGTFRPETPLAALLGEDADGPWQLILQDEAFNDVGTLLCWTLNITPNHCSGPATAPCESCRPGLDGRLHLPPLVTSTRLLRDGVPSLCGRTKVCPGTLGILGNLSYATHLFTNSGPATCVTVILQNSCGTSNLLPSAYSGAFNPASACANYLADAGDDSLVSTFSFPVGAGALFTVVVMETSPGTGCANYSLDVFGLPCPPPTLRIAPATPGKVRLHWNADGGEGYWLQAAPTLIHGATPFSTLGDVPALINGAYHVTNNASSNALFYRLSK